MTGAGAGSIGVFDSGVGGLTVAAALRRRLPHRRIVYLGDTARLPYGTKSAQTVRRYTERNVRFLVERGVELVVVACNSASALALGDDLDPALQSVPLLGVIEPGAERAAQLARRRVGVVATEATVSSAAYPRALARLRPELEVESVACPLLVPLVEEGWLDDDVTREVVARYTRPLLETGVDTVILGCTHYPLLAPCFGSVLGEDVRLVDSAEAVGDAVVRHLGEEAAEGPGASPPAPLELFVTDSSPRFGRIAEGILGEAVELVWVDTP